MARTNIVPTVVDMVAGSAAVSQAADAANGNMFDANDRTFVRLANTHATLAATVTFQTPGTVSGEAIGDSVVTVPAVSGVRYVGPFPANLFGQTAADAGKCYVDFVSGTVAIEVYRLAI